MPPLRGTGSETCGWAGDEKPFVQQDMVVAVCSTGKGSAEVCGSHFREDPAEHSYSDSCKGAGQICCSWPCHSICCGIWVSVLQVPHDPNCLLPAVPLPLSTRYSNIFVTSPSPENLQTLFDFVFRGFDALNYSEHEEYELVQSTNPEFNKAVVRVNIFREHRQTIQVCVWTVEVKVFLPLSFLSSSSSLLPPLLPSLLPTLPSSSPHLPSIPSTSTLVTATSWNKQNWYVLMKLQPFLFLSSRTSLDLTSCSWPPLSMGRRS